MVRYILASQSPRRSMLLKEAGLRFTIMPAQGEEVSDESDRAKLVEALSAHKAREIAERINNSVDEQGQNDLSASSEDSEDSVELTNDTVIIGADTIVACDGEVLGKPVDRRDANRMIHLLQGRKHDVFTGVTLIRLDDKKNIADVRSFHEHTEVEVYPMTEEEILLYTATDEPYDKAGAYGIQAGFMVYVKGIHGDYNNVVGLPVARLIHELKTFVNEE